VRSVLHHLTGGVDFTQIDGIGAYTALKLIAEIGTNMGRLAERAALHLVADAGPEEPSVRREAPELSDAALGESRGHPKGAVTVWSLARPRRAPA